MLHEPLKRGESVPPKRVARAFQETDVRIWRYLMSRQKAVLEGHVYDSFWDDVSYLGICDTRIPTLNAINQRLKNKTGWSVVPCDGKEADEDFFRNLSERRFSVATTVRDYRELDFATGPDIFHDIFGHAPSLVHRVQSEILHEIGKLGVCAQSKGKLHLVSNLYFKFVEAGMVGTGQDIKISGAAIISSYREARHCLDNPIRRIPFNMRTVLVEPFDDSDVQCAYYPVANSFEELLVIIKSIDLSDPRLA